MDNRTMFSLSLEKIKEEGRSRIPREYVRAFLRYAASQEQPIRLSVVKRQDGFATLARHPTPGQIRELLAQIQTSASLPDASWEDD